MANEIKNINQLKSELNHYQGGGQLFFRLNKLCNYTEGVKAYLEMARCQWLYDIIETEFFAKLKNLKLDTYYIDITVLKNKKYKSNSALIMLVDYKGNVEHSKEIEFTDHVEGEMKLHFGWHGDRAILCLTNED